MLFLCRIIQCTKIGLKCFLSLRSVISSTKSHLSWPHTEEIACSAMQTVTLSWHFWELQGTCYFMLYNLSLCSWAYATLEVFPLMCQNCPGESMMLCRLQSDPVGPPWGWRYAPSECGWLVTLCNRARDDFFCWGPVQSEPSGGKKKYHEWQQMK